MIITLQMLLGILKIGMYGFVGLEYHFTPKPLAGYVVLFLLGSKLDIIYNLGSSFESSITTIFFPDNNPCFFSSLMISRTVRSWC